MKPEKLTRRDWLKLGAVGVAGLSGATVLHLAGRGGAASSLAAAGIQEPAAYDPHGRARPRIGVYGDGKPGDGFDPMAYLTDFDYGEVSRTLSGRTVREYKIVSLDREIEVAPGVWFPAFTYNGQVPGPTIRCTEGDLLRIHFINAGSDPHTIHFHGAHPPEMDGLEPIVEPGQKFTYEFTARPFGLHLYHCHVMPLKRHIHKGLYGVFIVDPPEGRTPAREMVMVMNGFDTNFDGENEVYAVNTAPFYYHTHPLRVGVNDPVRVYLVNATEFDPVNSFHLHAAMFRVYRNGTRLDHYELTDTVMLCQGERHILELGLEHAGLHLFHAHQSEFAELGWMGFFDAVPRLAADAGVPMHRYG
ncbi:MAG: multicopper oxidase domain-containing protein [Gemmatimonadota bacterium]